jgi:hypothetical protein
LVINTGTTRRDFPDDLRATAFAEPRLDGDSGEA